MSGEVTNSQREALAVKPLLRLVLCLLAAQPAIAQIDPTNADTPMMTQILETREGSKIAIRYDALSWGDESAAGAVSDATGMKRYMTPRLALLQTNVQLKLGDDAIDPGSYFLGFDVQPNGDWHFLLSDAGGERVRMPMPVRQQPNFVPHLSFVFTPGLTVKDFVLNGLYGWASTSTRFIISGVPAETMDSAGGSLSDLTGLQSGANSAETRSSAAAPTVTPVTAPRIAPDPAQNATPRAKPKAGSGVFRRFADMMNEGL